MDGCCKVTGCLIAGPLTGQFARSQFLRTPAPGLGYYESNAMKKSVAVRLTVVAAVGIAARAQPRQDPCSAATFNEQACQAALQNGGYCWNGRWVGLKYHYAFPYYYDAYLDYLTTGGVSRPGRGRLVRAYPSFLQRSPRHLTRGLRLVGWWVSRRPWMTRDSTLISSRRLHFGAFALPCSSFSWRLMRISRLASFRPN